MKPNGWLLEPKVLGVQISNHRDG